MSPLAKVQSFGPKGKISLCGREIPFKRKKDLCSGEAPDRDSIGYGAPTRSRHERYGLH